MADSSCLPTTPSLPATCRPPARAAPLAASSALFGERVPSCPPLERSKRESLPLSGAPATAEKSCTDGITSSRVAQPSWMLTAPWIESDSGRFSARK